MGTTYVKGEVAELISLLCAVFQAKKLKKKMSDNWTIFELIKFYLEEHPVTLKKIIEDYGIGYKLRKFLKKEELI